LSFLPVIKARTVQDFIPSEWLELEMGDFSGGLCTAYPESHIRPNQFTAGLNYYIEQDNSLRVRGPYRPYDSAAAKETILTTAPKTFTWATLGATDYLIASSSGASGTKHKVEYWDSTSTTWGAIDLTLQPGYEIEFVKYAVNDAEDLIFCNGYDTPRRCTGAATATNLGLTVFPGVSNFVETSSGTVNIKGIQHNGTYYYQFTCNYDTSGTNTLYGESGPSATTSGVVVTAVDGAGTSAPTNVKITLGDIFDTTTNSKPANVSKINIYRSPPNEAHGPFEYIGYTSTTTFVDSVPVGEEGDETPADAGTPPELKNPLSFGGRIWGIGQTATQTLTNKGVWSEDGAPDMFLADSYAYFPDALVAVVAFKENVYWFTEKEIYVTPKADVATYPKPLKVCNIGATSYRSIVDVGNGLVFQGENNIYWVDFNTYNEREGDYPFPIGDPIKDKIRSIATAYKANSRACFYRDRYYLAYTTGQGTANNATLVWNVLKGMELLRQGLFGTWTELDWDANDLMEFDGELYTADATNKYIMEHDFAGAADYKNYTDYVAGSNYPINTDYRSPLMHFGHEATDKIIGSLSVVGESSGITYNAILELNDGEFQLTKSFTLGSGSLAVDSNWLIWNQGTWDNFNWGSGSYAFQTGHKKMGAGAKGKNAKVTLAWLLVRPV